jgi:hypothetical protein
LWSEGAGQLRCRHLLYAYAARDEDGALDLAHLHVRGRPHKASSYADMYLLLQYLFGWLPQPCSRRVLRALLNGQLKIWDIVICGTCRCLLRSGGDGEAAGFFYAGDVNVEPLAREELVWSANKSQRKRCRRQYVDGFAVLDGESEFSYPIIDGRYTVDKDWVETVVTRFGRGALLMAEGGLRRTSGASLDHTQ